MAKALVAKRYVVRGRALGGETGVRVIDKPPAQKRPPQEPRPELRVKERRSPDSTTSRRRMDRRSASVETTAQSIIFDVEGTLVDCAYQIMESWRRTLQNLGAEFSSLELHKYSGMDPNDMLRVLLPDTPDAEKDNIKLAQNKYYRENFLPGVNAFPGVRLLFERLRHQGHRIALATTCQGDELAAYLTLTGVTEFIDAVACGDDKVKGKPHPDLFRLALGRLGVRKHAVAIGDTPYDAIAAGRAGIRTIGTMSGGFSLRELEDAGCFAVVGRLPQMLEFV